MGRFFRHYEPLHKRYFAHCIARKSLKLSSKNLFCSAGSNPQKFSRQMSPTIHLPVPHLFRVFLVPVFCESIIFYPLVIINIFIIYKIVIFVWFVFINIGIRLTFPLFWLWNWIPLNHGTSFFAFYKLHSSSFFSSIYEVQTCTCFRSTSK